MILCLYFRDMPSRPRSLAFGLNFKFEFVFNHPHISPAPHSHLKGYYIFVSENPEPASNTKTVRDKVDVHLNRKETTSIVYRLDVSSLLDAIMQSTWCGRRSRTLTRLVRWKCPGAHRHQRPVCPPFSFLPATPTPLHF